ncbi:MAG TPA: hypothetical protein VIO60_01115 [Rectinemataceae bacterium]
MGTKPARLLALIVSILLVLLDLVSCQLSLSRTGTLVVRMEESTQGKNLGPGVELAVSSWDIEGTGPGGAGIQALGVKTDTQAFAGLIAGEWTVSATGRNADGIAVVGAAETIMVPENDVAYLALVCGLISGNGRLSISLTWPAASIDAPEIIAWIKNDGGFSRDYAPTEGSGTASWADSALPSGYYTLGIQLWERAGAGKLVWSTVQSVLVLAQRTTNGTWNLVDSELNALGTGSLDLFVLGRPASPLAVDIRGFVPRLAIGQTMTVRGKAYPGADSWAWYLDGLPNPAGTQESLTLGTGLSEGWHWLSLDAAGPEGKGSRTCRFEVTNAPALKNLPKAWGWNGYGQIGDGTARVTKYLPVDVVGTAGKSIAAVASGYGHSMMLTATGTLLAWGDNFCGQLGDGTVDERHTPILVENLPASTIVSIAAGNFHSLALMDDGSLWAWGANGSGQLGIGTQYSDQPYPMKVLGFGGLGVAAIAAGADHNLAIASDGSLWAWGANSSGQLGDGTTVDKYTPVRVAGLQGRTAAAIAAGHAHSLALLSDGSLLAWGANASGQLGDGTTTARKTPVNVGAVRNEALIAIAAGEFHSLALSMDGELRAWGGNAFGQLGNGGTAQSASPVLVAVPAGRGFVAIDSKGAHNLALAADGSLWAWGEGGAGQLGTGGSSNSSIPVMVQGLSGAPVVGFSAGYDHNLALSSEETI